MLKHTLEVFLSERKTAWLTKTTKGKEVKEDKLKLLNVEADRRYGFYDWLPKAVNRARPSITSHPSTFTHSDAKTTALKFIGNANVDGYLRTGNVSVSQPYDVFGNAATDSTVWDTYLFLTTKTLNNQLVFDHFVEQTDSSKNLVNLFGLNYSETRKKFMLMFATPTTFKTSQLLKQVYFPVDDDYHLLSLLTSSGLLNKLKHQIDDIRFSESTKQAKEQRKKNELHPTGYDDIYNLTVIGYGGTKPQNISVVNSQNAGIAYLLASSPPKLEYRATRLPTQDFFKNTLKVSAFKESFQSLHELIILDINNINIRQGINNILKFIIDQVLEKVFQLRSIELGWSNKPQYQYLPLVQKVWLDDFYQLQRETESEWITDVSKHFAKWMIAAYEIGLKNNAIILSDEELKHIRHYVEMAIQTDEVFFK